MKFNEDTDLSEIIGNYTRNNDYYKIEYLDGSISEYYNSDNKHEEILMYRMTKEALIRDKNLYEKYKKYIKTDLIKFLFSISILKISTKVELLFCIMFIYITFLIEKSLSDISKYKELSKYHDYLSIREDLKKIENRDILDIIEFDKIYQKPLNITTVDDYSAINLKILKKEINRRKNNC